MRGAPSVFLALTRTPQGRVATELSYKKLGLSVAKGNQPSFL